LLQPFLLVSPKGISYLIGSFGCYPSTAAYIC